MNQVNQQNKYIYINKEGEKTERNLDTILSLSINTSVAFNEK